MHTITAELAGRQPTCTYRPHGATRTNRRFDDGVCGARATYRFRLRPLGPWKHVCTTDMYRLDLTLYIVEELT